MSPWTSKPFSDHPNGCVPTPSHSLTLHSIFMIAQSLSNNMFDFFLCLDLIWDWQWKSSWIIIRQGKRSQTSLIRTLFMKTTHFIILTLKMQSMWTNPPLRYFGQPTWENRNGRIRRISYVHMVKQALSKFPSDRNKFDHFQGAVKIEHKST